MDQMYLAIDYGKSKVGLAVSSGKLASPLTVVRYENRSALLNRIGQIIEEENIEKIVVGVSEGKMAEESVDFGHELREKFEIEVDFFDETLTSRDALQRTVEAGMNRKKRKSMEDAFAATLILQNYLDSQG